MQAVDAADFAQHGLAQLHAVIDLRRRRQVEQHAGQLLVVVLYVHAADQVGLVFLVGQPARSRRGGALFGQHEDGRAARRRLDERVGVDRDEQVGLHLARLFHAHAQRDEEIGVAREHDAHVRLQFQLGFQALGDGQHHVFFAAAAAAHGARVFAAVAGVERDGNHAHHFLARQGARFGALFRADIGHGRHDGRHRRRDGHGRLAAVGQGQRGWRRMRVGHQGLGRVARPVALFDHLRDQVRLVHGIQIEDQTVVVGAGRRQGKQLRRDFFLQVEDQAHHVGPVLAHAHLLDVRVVRLDLRHQAFQGGIELQSFDVDHQPFRVLDDEVGRLQDAVVFQGDARVVLGRPDAHGENLRRHRRHGREHGQQQGAAGLEYRAPGDGRGDQRFGANLRR